jgi:hypothetical protein
MAQILFGIVTWLSGWLVIYLPVLFWRLLAVMGIGLVTFSGFEAITAAAAGFFAARIGEFPADMLAIMNLAGFQTGLNMLLSGVSAFFTIKVALGVFAAFKPNPNVLRA